MTGTRTDATNGAEARRGHSGARALRRLHARETPFSWRATAERGRRVAADQHCLFALPFAKFGRTKARVKWRGDRAESSVLSCGHALCESGGSLTIFQDIADGKLHPFPEAATSGLAARNNPASATGLLCRIQRLCSLACSARAAPIALLTCLRSSGGGSTAFIPSDSSHSSRHQPFEW